MVDASTVALPQLKDAFGRIVPSAGEVAVDSSGRALFGSAVAIGGTLTTVGAASSSINLRGPFNATVSASGSSPNGSTIAIERSFDGGVSWAQAHSFQIGADFIFADGGPMGAPIATGSSVTYSEPEAGVLYRVHAVALPTGATITYRLSQ